MPRRRKEPERRRGAVVVRGLPRPNRRTEDQELLRSAAPGPAFRDTDPWRALRIMSEFVEGFDALARLGPAVSLFGSARTPRDHPWYRQAEIVGAGLARAARPGASVAGGDGRGSAAGRRRTRDRPRSVMTPGMRRRIPG